MKKLVSLLMALTFATSANAILMTEVSDNAYITVDGYDIAWAAPCALVTPSCGPVDLSYQSQFGWEAMSSTLFNQLGITASDFMFEGANVDAFTGNNLDEISGATLAQNPSLGDIAVAAPWFSNNYLHVDWINGDAGLWSFSDNNGVDYGESLVVRVSQNQPIPCLLYTSPSPRD